MAFSTKEHLKKITRLFDPSKTNGRKMTIVFKFQNSGENDGVWTIRIDGEVCTLEEGEAAEYTSKIISFAEGYERVVTGKMWPLCAYWNGTIRYLGNTLEHEELQTYLTIPKDDGIAFF